MRIGSPDTALLDLPDTDASEWPAQVDLVLSAMESGQHVHRDQRKHKRVRYRTVAHLQLFSDAPSTAPWRLYTRDACDRGLGFITQHCLPLGYGGVAEVQMPDSQILQIPCTINRCRQAAPGWYEGSLHFNRERPEFAAGARNAIRGSAMKLSV